MVINHMENQQNQNPTQDPNLETHSVWGTWEELLLACAVNRHGSKDWDTVAMEVQSRTTLLATARHCEQKFHDLNLRFADKCYDHSPPPWQNGATVATAGDGTDHVPWLDELRKQRVDELRRQVQHHDVSILSLQLKVKRLEEEREKENGGKEEEEKPDLEVPGKKRPENDKTGGEQDEPEEPVSSEPVIRRFDESTTNVVDKALPTQGEESDRENQSVNESNSTGSRFEGIQGMKDGRKDIKLENEPGPVHDGLKEPDETGRKGKPVGEESNNGSCDTVAAKVLTCESVPPSEERKVDEEEEDEDNEGDGDSSELRDSVAQESSDVQSSASLTRKRNKRRRKEVCGGGEVRAVARSEPLVGVLEMIRKHEHSSLFERRLDSQESDEYKNIIKQHMDLETIQLKLQKGHYSSRTLEFFADLYLLFNNAIVFFPKDSRESRAAAQLRSLLAEEMKNHGQAQSDPITQKTDSQSPNPPPQAKVDSLLSKQKSSAPIVVCRKRSSMSSKPSSATFGLKGDQPIINDKKEKPTSDPKPPLKPSSSAESDEEEEEEPPKAKEKPVTGARSLRRSNKNINSSSSNKKLPSISSSKTGSSANKPAEAPKQEKTKEEKNKAEGSTEKKRTAAAKFLKRMKGNTPVEVPKSGGGSSSSSKGGGGGGGGGREQKKIVNSGKGDKGKERSSRHNNNGGGSGSGDKRNKNTTTESSSQSKRSVGRPPKKGAESSNAGSAKRGRGDSSASAGKDKRPKKRSKK